MSEPRVIDTFREELISVDEAAEHVAKIHGKRKNRNQITRWMRRGCWGLKLPSIRVGRDCYTSTSALNEFLNRVQQNATWRDSDLADRSQNETSDGYSMSADEFEELLEVGK